MSVIFYKLILSLESCWNFTKNNSTNLNRQKYNGKVDGKGMCEGETVWE